MLDLYWGGPERRITGLTVRIIAINAFALLLLLIGIIYLSQYRTTLIEGSLKNFKSDAEMISNALSESLGAQDSQEYNLETTKRLVWRFSIISEGRIYVFDSKGNLMIDSDTLSESENISQFTRMEPEPFSAIRILKDLARFILVIIPTKKPLPEYKNISSTRAADYFDVPAALSGDLSITPWIKDDGIFLTGAVPLIKNGEITGAVMIARAGHDIQETLGDVWLSIFGIFIATLVITIFLSIYISNTIATPLKKLARAAEAVRIGRSKDTEIPDLSERKDEIGELSLVLRAMTHALWDRMDSIERFAADVAHELKNPLTSMRSAVETLNVVKKDKDREKLLGILNHDVERMDRLITDISSASRLDSELSREALVPVDLNALFKIVMERYDSPFIHNQNNVKVILDIPQAKSLQVWGLESRLFQVMDNLIANAISFSPAQGVVAITVSKARKTITITVEDQGPGIPENKLETIFERFYTERPEHEAYGKHSGLGLSICRQIVTAMGGNIFASNVFEDGKRVTGARFTVILNAA